MKLFSLYRSKTHSHWPGDAHLHLAREEDGRWIVPGEVEFYTMEGTRSLVYFLAGSEPTGLILPLPARPDRTFLEWSDWLPSGSSPETEAALRFRLRRHTPPASLPYEEHVRLEAEADLAERIKTFSAIDPSYLGAADISRRFSAWMAAARYLRETAGGDFVPELRKISNSRKSVPTASRCAGCLPRRQPLPARIGRDRPAPRRSEAAVIPKRPLREEILMTSVQKISLAPRRSII